MENRYSRHKKRAGMNSNKSGVNKAVSKTYVQVDLAITEAKIIKKYAVRKFLHYTGLRMF